MLRYWVSIGVTLPEVLGRAGRGMRWLAPSGEQAGEQPRLAALCLAAAPVVVATLLWAPLAHGLVVAIGLLGYPVIVLAAGMLWLTTLPLTAHRRRAPQLLVVATGGVIMIVGIVLALTNSVPDGARRSGGVDRHGRHVTALFDAHPNELFVR